MEKIAIITQVRVPKSEDDPLSANNFVVHTYPFTTLGTFQSHVHPEFVILETGRRLRSRLTGAYLASSSYPELAPSVQAIQNLYEAWTSFEDLPTGLLNELGIGGNNGKGTDDGDSVMTPPGRG